MKRSIISAVSLFLTGALFFCLITVDKKTKSVSASHTNEITVIVDAGHGGEDGGAIGKSGSYEKNINLDIALKVNEYLSLLGIKTYMVRTDDRAVGDNSLPTLRERKISDIHTRAALMDSVENCIFLSIHQNEFSEAYVHGTQIFYSPNNEESKHFAEILQKTVCGLTQPQNKKVPKASGTSIYVLYNATRPACLCECGFVSNSDEEKLLLSNSYQKKISLAISYGVLNFLISEGNNGTEV